MINIPSPYLIFLGGQDKVHTSKVAIGINYWCKERIIGQARFEDCKYDLKVADLSPVEAVKMGAKTLVIGVSNLGGGFSSDWIGYFKESLNAGLNIANGMHDRLNSNQELVDLAKSKNRLLIDVRYPKGPFKTATGEKRSGKRLLTVGSDCNVGKMFTSLSIYREMQKNNLDVSFKATGQTGIFISGDGIPLDGVVCDFISGAIEKLSPSNKDSHFDIIEGQGSLIHPSFAGVTLGLIHGSQPDAMVMCHEWGRKNIHGLKEEYGYRILDLNDIMQQYLQAARLVNSKSKFIGLSIYLPPELDNDVERNKIKEESQRLGLICSINNSHTKEIINELVNL